NRFSFYLGNYYFHVKTKSCKMYLQDWWQSLNKKYEKTQIYAHTNTHTHTHPPTHTHTHTHSYSYLQIHIQAVNACPGTTHWGTTPTKPSHSQTQPHKHTRAAHPR